MTWYCIRSAARQEARAEAGLIQRGFTVYLPRERRKQMTPWRETVIERPLFQGYMFVRCDVDHGFRNALEVEGVHQFLRWMGSSGDLEPAPFPDMLILGLQMDERGGLFDRTIKTAKPKFNPKKGERAVISGSMWAGCLGTILKLKASERRAYLELDRFGKTWIPYDHLESAA